MWFLWQTWMTDCLWLQTQVSHSPSKLPWHPAVPNLQLSETWSQNKALVTETETYTAVIFVSFITLKWLPVKHASSFQHNTIQMMSTQRQKYTTHNAGFALHYAWQGSAMFYTLQWILVDSVPVNLDTLPLDNYCWNTSWTYSWHYNIDIALIWKLVNMNRFSRNPD